MDEQKIDMSAVDPSRDPERWETLVQSVAARALETRRRRLTVGHQLLSWARPALAIAAEFLGSLALVSGLLSRVAAFGIMVTMALAGLSVHLSNGFFMNWFGAQKGEGIEYFILAIGLALTVVINGGGALSFDRFLSKRSDS